MADRLTIVAGFAVGMGSLYLAAMRSSPRRGWLRAVERFFAGIILCWLCHMLLRPFGLNVPQNPLAALAAGWLGLPGVALPAVVAGWM